MVTRVGIWVSRHWKKLLLLRVRLPLNQEALYLAAAVLIGIAGGVSNFVFSQLQRLMQGVIFGSSEEITVIAGQLEWWQRLVVPTLGAFGAALILYGGLKLLSNPGLSNLIEVVVAGDGRLALRSSLIQAFSSLFSISTGASIGREGPIIQVSATLASKGGQLLRWAPYRLRLLVACGAAAGIAASCHAPIAGAVFAAQIVLANFSMNLFAPLLCSAVVASVVSRSFFGVVHWFEVPHYDFTELSQLPWFAVLGLCSGMFGALFLKLLTLTQVKLSATGVHISLRFAMAGLAVGAIALLFPGVWGNGYGTTNVLLHQDLALSFLVGLLCAKLIATVVTVGVGTIGGVFTPTLFLGAGLGTLFGAVLHKLGLAVGLPMGAFGLVGMGAMLAATTHSSLLAIIMLFELSLNYSIVPPLMLACAVSTVVSTYLHKDSIYTEPLRRKGLEPHRESTQIGAATHQFVGDLMKPPVPPLLETASLREISERFLTGTNNFLPIVNGVQKLVGVVALHDLKDVLSTDQEIQGVIAYDIMRPPPVCVTPQQTLTSIVSVLLMSELRNIPVVNNTTELTLLGSIDRTEALSILSEAISARSTPAGG